MTAVASVSYCRKCKNRKPFYEFERSEINKSGYLKKCKECVKKYGLEKCNSRKKEKQVSSSFNTLKQFEATLCHTN